MIVAPHKLRSQRLKARIMPVMTDHWRTVMEIAEILDINRFGAQFECIRYHLRSLLADKLVERREENSTHGARKRHYYRKAQANG